MPTTITSYTTFSAGTRARAGEVNTNFSNYRGDILPIETDTATASHRTHDIGSSEHYFDQGYFQGINFGLTSTAVPNIGASTVGAINITFPTTTGNIVFLFAGTTGANTLTVSQSGIDRTGFAIKNSTFTASKTQSTNGAWNIFTLTMPSDGRHALIFELEPVPGTTGSCYIYQTVSLAATSVVAIPTFQYLLIGGVTQTSLHLQHQKIFANPGAGATSLTYTIAFSDTRFRYEPPGATAETYQIAFNPSSHILGMQNVRLRITVDH